MGAIAEGIGGGGYGAGRDRGVWRERRADLAWWGLGLMAALPALLAVRLLPQHAALAALAGLGLVAGGLLVLDNPAWGACALILLIYWNASDVVTDTWGFTWLLKLAMTGVVAAAAWDIFVRDRRRAGRWPVLLPVLAYGAAQVAAAVGAVDAVAARAALLEYGKALVVFYLVTNLLRTPRALRWGVNAVLGAVVLLAAPVIYQGVSGVHNQFWGFGAMIYEEIVPGQFGWRLGGAMGDPNFLALVLVASLPLALMQALEAGAGWRRGWGLLATAAALGATLFTYSRASLFGVALVAVVLAVKHRRRRWVIAGAALALLGAAALMPQDFFGRLQSLAEITEIHRQELPDTSFQTRRNALYAGALMFAHHPLLGVGPGNYPANYLQYSALVGLAVDPVRRDPHNLYIQIAAETGLVGIGTFLALMWCSFGLMERGRRRLRRLRADHFADLVWALELALATYLLLSLFLHGAYFRHFLLLLALGTLGGAMALEKAAPRHPLVPSLPAPAGDAASRARGRGC